MTPQEIFETVSRHLFAQGQRATLVRDSEGEANDVFCAYRGENGTKCAVGILIPDEVYSPSMEGVAAYALLRDFSIPGLSRGAHTELLERLQDVHDNDYSWNASSIMREQLHEIGVEYDLETDFLDDLKFADGR